MMELLGKMTITIQLKLLLYGCALLQRDLTPANVVALITNRNTTTATNTHQNSYFFSSGGLFLLRYTTRGVVAWRDVAFYVTLLSL